MSLKQWRLQTLSSSDGTGNGTRVVNIDSDDEHYDYNFCPNLIHNVPHPPFIHANIWNQQRQKLKFREGDVVVCTFSKCGTTLMEQIVLLLLNGGDSSKLDPLSKNTMDPTNPSRLGKIWPEMAVIDGLEDEDEQTKTSNGEDERKDQGVEKACMGEGRARMSLQQFQALPDPRVIKTHAPRELFLGQDNNENCNEVNKVNPLTKGVKVIYVTRNPFDACVSCYYHPKPGISPASTGCTFEAFARLWLSDRVEFGGWANHINGWYKELLQQKQTKNDENQMIWITYEDIILNPAASIEKIANFLNIPCDQDLVERVADGCKFENVKSAAAEALASGASGNVSHLRKGKIGDWRNHFSNDLKQEFEAALGEMVDEHVSGMKFHIGNDKLWKLPYKNSCGLQQKLSNDSEDSADKNIEASQNDISPSSSPTTFVTDIKVVSITLISLNILQTVLSYINEFHVDDLRDGGYGQDRPGDIPIITVVIANIFNGLSAGIALSTFFCARIIISSQWSGVWQMRCAKYYMLSNIVEAVVTSGVLHSLFHRIYGAVTVMGNGYVEFIFHLAYTINVIVTSVFLFYWLAYEQNVSAGSLTRAWDWIVGAIAAGLGIAFSCRWVQYITSNEDLDFDLEHSGNYQLIDFLQGRVQGVIEAVLLIPTIALLCGFYRLWKHIKSNNNISNLQRTSYRIFVLAAVTPLAMNWFHFRLHDSLLHSLRVWTGLTHAEIITVIRVLFHIPNWTLSIIRNHYFRRLTEDKAGYTIIELRHTLYPGGSVFPFLMIFLFRASEGMTLSLLPTFFQGSTATNNFHLDITENKWVAATVLGMFLANTFGSIGLGNLMQLKGYIYSYRFMIGFFAILFPIFMVPQTKTSFLILRCITSLLFPGPVVLSRITEKTRDIYKGNLKHVPMIVALIWFNQGFAAGGLISASQVFTSWNVFFTSSIVLTLASVSILVSFMICTRKGNTLAKAEEDDNGIKEWDKRRDESSTLLSSSSKAKNEDKISFPVRMDVTEHAEAGDSSDSDHYSPMSPQCQSRDSNTNKGSKSATRANNSLVLESSESMQKKPATERPGKLQHLQGLWLAKVASFFNGLSFACHIALLGIQVTSIVTLDKYEFTIIVSSLGTVSTILILVCSQFLSSRHDSVNILLSYMGHMIGTAILGVPQVYNLPRGFAVMIIIGCYAIIFLSFFMMNLSCESIVKEESRKEQQNNAVLPVRATPTRTLSRSMSVKEAMSKSMANVMSSFVEDGTIKKASSAGMSMGQVKAYLSLGKVCGSIAVLFGHEAHAQLPIWIVEGLLLLSFVILIGMAYFKRSD